MYTVNESYRLKKMANLVEGYHFLIDVGFSHMPNPFLKNKTVLGIDIVKSEKPENYSEIFQGSLEEYRVQAIKSPDALLAGEILEHIEHPASFLQTCFELLSHKGVLVLSTPNPNSPIERLLTLTLSRRYFYTSDHLFSFPQRWLIRLLEHSGFRKVKLLSGGFPIPVIGTVAFPRPWCHQTIAIAYKR